MRTLTLLNPHNRFGRRRSRRFRPSFGRIGRRAGSRSLRSFGLRSNPFTASEYTGPDILLNPRKRRKKSTRKPHKTMAKKHRRRRRSTVRRNPASRRGKGRYKVTTFKSKRRGSKGRRMVRLKTRFGSVTLRRNPSLVGNIGSMFRNVVSKDNLQTAGGVIGASVLNKLVFANFGDKLPMASNTAVNAVYQAAIPSLAAIAVRKFAPKVAEGLVLGGVVLAVNGLLKQFMPTLSGFSSYVDATPPQPILPYPTGNLSPITGSVDSATRMNANIGENTMGYSGIYDSPMPFQSDAWSN